MPINQKLLNKSLALICVVVHRELDIKPYSVQIMASLAIYNNFAIEMHTGEGKTITAALSAILHGWSGKPCHIVTSNEYLASRDASNLESLYQRCGLTVGCITSTMQNQERKKNYKKSIVYSTSGEFLADFLRDQMDSDDAIDFNKFLINKIKHKNSSNQVMQGLHTVIIDEADSVLADEAITPLIISIPKENKPLNRAIKASKLLADKLQKDVHYEIDLRYKDIYFTKKGEKSIDELIKDLPAIWQSKNKREYLLRQALLAREFYIKDTHYVIIDEKIIIVDEKTGRLMHSRSWGGRTTSSN